MAEKYRTPTNNWQRFLIDELKAAGTRVRHAEGCLKRCKPGTLGHYDWSVSLLYEKESEELARKAYEEQWNENPKGFEEFYKGAKE